MGMFGSLLIALVAFASINIFNVLQRQPIEILAWIPVTGPVSKDVHWERYRSEFTKFSTPLVDAETLAAISYTESSGNPLARPPWIFKPKLDFWNSLKPQSTAFGLMQFTQSTFAEAQTLAQLKGFRPFPFFTRASPEQSIALTSLYLEEKLRSRFRRPERWGWKLPAVVHLCGVNRAKQWTNSSAAVQNQMFCGSHKVSRYLHEVAKMRFYYSEKGSQPVFVSSSR